MKNCEWFEPKEYSGGNNHEWSLETGWFSNMLNKEIQKARSNSFGVGGRTLEVILSQYSGQTFVACLVLSFALR